MLQQSSNFNIAFIRNEEYIPRMSLVASARADLFRLLGDEGRLRLLALCAEEELTVGELAGLLAESQPQVTKKSQPLREAGLLASRRDGTRTLLRTVAAADAVVAAALEEGRALSTKDGSLAKIASIIAAREEASRRYFEEKRTPGTSEPVPALDSELTAWLPVLAPLLPGRALAVDVGTGEGTLLPLLSPLYERVIAVDRSPARLASCSARIAAWGLPNVRLLEGHVEDAGLAQDIGQRGGADLVLPALACSAPAATCSSSTTCRMTTRRCAIRAMSGSALSPPSCAPGSRAPAWRSRRCSRCHRVPGRSRSPPFPSSSASANVPLAICTKSPSTTLATSLLTASNPLESHHGNPHRVPRVQDQRPHPR
jgi:ArsR family transcriptional regulator